MSPTNPKDGDSHLRILVIDDHVDSADTLAMLVRIWGFEVDVAYDGKQGLGRAEAAHPAIILSDIGMPELDGYAFARRLREDASFRGTTLIAISGYGSDDARKRSREAGFDFHFTKPIDPSVLNDLLHIIEKRKARADGDGKQLSDSRFIQLKKQGL